MNTIYWAKKWIFTTPLSESYDTLHLDKVVVMTSYDLLLNFTKKLYNLMMSWQARARQLCVKPTWMIKNNVVLNNVTGQVKRDGYVRPPPKRDKRDRGNR